MSSGSPRIPDVILPWAQSRFFPGGSAEAHAGSHGAGDTLDVVRTAKDPQRQAILQQEPSRADGASVFLDGRLRALGLPATPFPTIAEADRPEVSTDTMLHVAVILDVLASLTRRKLKRSPQILHELLETLREVAGLTEDRATDADYLLAQAENRLGNCRALLASHMTRVGRRSSQDETASSPIVSGTPGSASEAVRFIEKMAQLCVREADLYLTAQDGVDYRRA